MKNKTVAPEFKAIQRFDQLSQINDGKEFLALLSRLQNRDIYQCLFAADSVTRHKFLRNFPAPVRDALGYVIEDHRGGCSKEDAEDSQARIMTVANILLWWFKSLSSEELDNVLSQPPQKRQDYVTKIESLRASTEEELIELVKDLVCEEAALKGVKAPMFQDDLVLAITSGSRSFSFIVHKSALETPTLDKNGFLNDTAILNYVHLSKNRASLDFDYRIDSEFGKYTLDKNGSLVLTLKEKNDGSVEYKTEKNSKLIHIGVETKDEGKPTHIFREAAPLGVTKLAGEPVKPKKPRRANGPIG